ncbi:hypothetical protein V8G54_017541, partial [Vigna mungo]
IRPCWWEKSRRWRRHRRRSLPARASGRSTSGRRSPRWRSTSTSRAGPHHDVQVVTGPVGVGPNRGPRHSRDTQIEVVFAFNPHAEGHGVLVRLHPRNGRSMLTDGAAFLSGSPRFQSSNLGIS